MCIVPLFLFFPSVVVGIFVLVFMLVFSVLFMAYNYSLLLKVGKVFLSNIPVVDFACNLHCNIEIKEAVHMDLYTWLIFITRVYILMLSFVFFNHIPFPCYIILERMEPFWPEIHLILRADSTFIMQTQALLHTRNTFSQRPLL